MDEELLERLRALMGRMPADATAAPVGRPLGRPVPQPTIGPVSPGTPPSPRPARGLLAAVARSAQAGGGLANELLNPVRAGASARQMVNEAIPAARQGNIGRAAGLGALAAMSVPGVPGPDDAARGMKNTLNALQELEQYAARLAGETEAMRMLAGPGSPTPRLVKNPAYVELADRRSEIARAMHEAGLEKAQARRILRGGEEWRGNLAEAQQTYAGAKDRTRSLLELFQGLTEQMKRTPEYVPDVP